MRNEQELSMLPTEITAGTWWTAQANMEMRNLVITIETIHPKADVQGVSSKSKIL